MSTGFIDASVFYPDMPEGASVPEQIGILCDAMMKLGSELTFRLSSLGRGNLTDACVKEIAAEASAAVKVGVLSARLWSAIPSGEIIPVGSFVIYGGRFFVCAVRCKKSDVCAPRTGGDDDPYWRTAT